MPQLKPKMNHSSRDRGGHGEARAAVEHGEDGVVENEVGCGHNEADDDAEDDGAADAAVGVVVCAGAEVGGVGNKNLVNNVVE